MLNFSPLAGLFHFEPTPTTEDTVVTFRIPRQADDSLIITIHSEESPAARFPLGEYINRLGYNWKADELQDIYVSIDLARGLVDLQIADWEEGATFPLIEQ